jgi:hypothetical protein
MNCLPEVHVAKATLALVTLPYHAVTGSDVFSLSAMSICVAADLLYHRKNLVSAGQAAV